MGRRYLAALLVLAHRGCQPHWRDGASAAPFELHLSRQRGQRPARQLDCRRRGAGAAGVGLRAVPATRRAQSAIFPGANFRAGRDQRRVRGTGAGAVRAGHARRAQATVSLMDDHHPASARRLHHAGRRQPGRPVRAQADAGGRADGASDRRGDRGLPRGGAPAGTFHLGEPAPGGCDRGGSGTAGGAGRARLRVALFFAVRADFRGTAELVGAAVQPRLDARQFFSRCVAGRSLSRRLVGLQLVGGRDVLCGQPAGRMGGADNGRAVGLNLPGRSACSGGALHDYRIPARRGFAPVPGFERGRRRARDS